MFDNIFNSLDIKMRISYREYVWDHLDVKAIHPPWNLGMTQDEVQLVLEKFVNMKNDPDSKVFDPHSGFEENA